MAQFFTLSFELDASEGKTDKIISTVRSYLVNQGAKDILFTHSGDPAEDDEEEDNEPAKSSSRRR